MNPVMRDTYKAWNRFCVGENGGGLVEYTLILALIAIVAVTLLTNIGTNLQTKLTSVKTSTS